jgi:hypothetical protein
MDGTKSYVMVYEGGRQVPGATHPQVDSGFGFTCDEDVLPIVQALFAAGFRTVGSCQNTNESSYGDLWMIPRAYVAFMHDNPRRVMDLCLHVREFMALQERPGVTLGWNQKIEVDTYYVPSNPFATLDYGAKALPFLMTAIASFLVHSARTTEQSPVPVGTVGETEQSRQPCMCVRCRSVGTSSQTPQPHLSGE